MSITDDIDSCEEVYSDHPKDTGEPKTLRELRQHDVDTIVSGILSGIISLGDLARQTDTADFVSARSLRDIILTAQLVGSIIDARKPPPLKIVGRAS